MTFQNDLLIFQASVNFPALQFTIIMGQSKLLKRHIHDEKFNAEDNNDKSVDITRMRAACTHAHTLFEFKRSPTPVMN
jgi:hypothetical protein